MEDSNVHPVVEIYRPLLLQGRIEWPLHPPSDCGGRRAEDIAVHHHSLPFDGGVILALFCENRWRQICKAEDVNEKQCELVTATALLCEQKGARHRAASQRSGLPAGPTRVQSHLVISHPHPRHSLTTCNLPLTPILSFTLSSETGFKREHAKSSHIKDTHS